MMAGMTIDEATEVLRNYLRGDEPDNPPDLPASIRLGIEALKEVKNSRSEDYIGDTGLLPGETQD